MTQLRISVACGQVLFGGVWVFSPRPSCLFPPPQAEPPFVNLGIKGRGILVVVVCLFQCEDNTNDSESKESVEEAQATCETTVVSF